MGNRTGADKLLLYAWRGVSRECPENTLAALRAAICQGYDGAAVDVQVTADGVAVLGRKMELSGLTASQALSLSAGVEFSHKFRGETVPKLSDALNLAKAAGLKICLMMDLVPEAREADVFLLLSGFQNIMLCFREPRRICRAAEAVPQASLGYLGPTIPEIMQSLARFGGRLTTWTKTPEQILPWEDRWGRLGVFGVDSYDRLDAVLADHRPAAIGSSGVVKPDIRRGFQADVHIHSEYSQDSDCPISDIRNGAVIRGMDLVCITDHCDIHPGEDSQALLKFRKQVVSAVRENAQLYQDLRILAGVELGGGFLEPEIADRVTAGEDYDLVIGSVHGIRFQGERRSTSHFDFGAATETTVLEYLEQYMDAELYVAEKLDVDVLAHLTYIFRYINGKYRLDLDWRVQEDKIRRVLAAIIARGIPLEINTSCLGGSYNEWLPSREIVDIYLEMGGYLFTLGSDAHVSRKIGTGFAEVKAYLREKGVRYLMFFVNRIPHQYGI